MPIDTTAIKTLYIFVEIGIDSTHLAGTIRLNFPPDRQAFHSRLLDEEKDAAEKIAPGDLIEAGLVRLELESPETPAEPPAEVALASASATTSPEPTRIALVSTIQFVASIQRLKEDLSEEYQPPPTPQASRDPVGLLTGGEQGVPLPVLGSSSVPQTKLWTGKYEMSIPRSKPLSPGEILGCTAPCLSDVDALM